MRSGALADWLLEHRPPLLSLLPLRSDPRQVLGYSALEAQSRPGTSFCWLHGGAVCLPDAAATPEVQRPGLQLRGSGDAAPSRGALETRQGGEPTLPACIHLTILACHPERGESTQFRPGGRFWGQPRALTDGLIEFTPTQWEGLLRLSLELPYPGPATF